MELCGVFKYLTIVLVGYFLAIGFAHMILYVDKYVYYLI